MRKRCKWLTITLLLLFIYTELPSNQAQGYTGGIVNGQVGYAGAARTQTYLLTDGKTSPVFTLTFSSSQDYVCFTPKNANDRWNIAQYVLDADGGANYTRMHIYRSGYANTILPLGNGNIKYSLGATYLDVYQVCLVNVSGASLNVREFDFFGAIIDKTPPSLPTGLNATPDLTEITIKWTASASADLAGYNLYRNGSKINAALLTGTSYIDTDLTPGTNYTYTMTAVDTTGNVSAQTTALNTKTDLSIWKGFTKSQASLISGELSVSAPTAGSFGSIDLTGSTQTVSTDLGPLIFSDATGRFIGYNIQVRADQMKQVGGDNHLFPTSSLKLDQPSNIEVLAGHSGLVPSVSLASSAFIDTGSPVKVISAAVSKGAGEYQVNFAQGALSLVVNPAYVYIDGGSSSYETTITWSIISGP